MVKYYVIIFLIINCLHSSLADVNNIFSKNLDKSGKEKLYTALAKIFHICKLRAKKIIIYDSDYTLEGFSAPSRVQRKFSASLFNRKNEWQLMGQYQLDNLKVDIIIVTIKSNSAWKELRVLFQNWRYNRDCIIYIFPRRLSDCAIYKNILEWIMRFYFSKAYFICLSNGTTYFYTHDPYGDTKPPHWKTNSQSLLWGKKWTFYERSLANLSQLCPGFNFNRTDPSSQEFVVFGLFKNLTNRKHFKNKNQFDNDEIERSLSAPHQEIITGLRKLLKYKFKYFTITPEKDAQFTFSLKLANLGVDGLIMNKLVTSNKGFTYFYPTMYENVAIISHHHGLMTPLEKIARYYGKWTLSSLIIILIISFTVMWFSTKKLSLTTFNIVRLLINTEIITPMNTWSLKMFFSMIFLYFLIIHATFSGHLAEFLTKIEYRPNIDTIEELKDPTIEKIFLFGYNYNTATEFSILRQKSMVINHSTECNQIIFHSNYACIAPKIVFELALKNIKSNTLHISKNTFGLKLAGYPCRRGFPLREKFDWAFMYLFETTITSQWLTTIRQSRSRKIEKQAVMDDVKYRSIIVSDLNFAFLLLIIGNCIGIICFLLEITFKNYCRRFNNQR